MIGKQIKSNPIGLLVEYSHFSGNEKEIFFMLNAFLKAILKNEKFFIIKLDSISKNPITKTLEKFNNYDSCINVFDFDNHSLLFENVSNFKKADFKKAYPIRNLLFNKNISALIFLEDTTKENSFLIELIAGISSMKLEIANMFINTKDISKYYNFGKVSPQIFHEIKNKLIAPYTFLQSFHLKKNDENFLNNFSKLALEELIFIQKQIENSLIYGKELKETSNKKNIPFKNVLSPVLTLLEPKLQKMHINVFEKINIELIFPIPYHILKDILLNLLLNAIDSLDSSKNEKVIKIKTFDLKNYFGFSIEDTGIGIHDKNIPHLFESFYTTKSQGTGLGLTIVKGEIEKYNGLIEIESKFNFGTKVLIKFHKNFSPKQQIFTHKQ